MSFQAKIDSLLLISRCCPTKIDAFAVSVMVRVGDTFSPLVTVSQTWITRAQPELAFLTRP